VTRTYASISDVLRVLAGQTIVDASRSHPMRLDEYGASIWNRYCHIASGRIASPLLRRPCRDREYAAHLTSANRKVRVLTPLHTGLGTPPGPIQLVSVLWHDFEGVRRRVEFLKPIGPGSDGCMFTAKLLLCRRGRDRSNPYIYASDDTDCEQSPQLVRDCLFYATVAPKVLGALHLVDNLVIHLQDWETAGVALSVKSAVSGRILPTPSPFSFCTILRQALGSDGWAKLTDLPDL